MPGDLKTCSIKGRIFPVIEDNDPEIQRGGRAPVELGMNGDGTGVIRSKIYGWMIDGIEVRLDPDRDDIAFLQEVQSSAQAVDITIVDADDVAEGGQGNILEPVRRKPQGNTASLKLAGPGTLEQQ